MRIFLRVVYFWPKIEVNKSDLHRFVPVPNEGQEDANNAPGVVLSRGVVWGVEGHGISLSCALIDDAFTT